mmetsp:Transcript_157913/g.506466  ORF Transcript_157913/g.506466 Transcript_157913/m.506466 type:complete len:227 (-) Transcript_157913:77-757(-)
MAGSLDPAMGGNCADMIFKSRALRPFLDHPGFDHGCESAFVKPAISVNPQFAKAHPLSCNSFLPFGLLGADGADLARRRPLAKQGLARRGPSKGALGGDVPSQRGSASRCGSMASRPAAAGRCARELPMTGRAGSAGTLSFYVEGDPALIPFSEEPEDPRVRVPAHRIGDTSSPPRSQVARARRGGAFETGRRESSAPTLLVAARRAPVHFGNGRGGGLLLQPIAL